ncbi:hypothetical protein PMAC_003210 [Pneumocystis sp. 'macacae']|nr:hypothetical protein PMAC_003210 [Pneumocystis sp. 'macacae']
MIRYFTSGKRCNKEIKKTESKKDKSTKNNIDKTHIQRKKSISSTMQSESIQWLTDPTKGGKFRKLQSTPGRNFISGKEYPYPSNPAFRPPIPLSLNVRKDIGKKWKQGKSIREISEMFGISSVRVEAILRLLELESKWHQEGKTLDSYARIMHHMLGSTTNQTINEPDFFISIPSDNQNFITIPENSEFTSKNASDQLQRPLYSNVKEKLIQSQLNNSKYNKSDVSSNKKIKVENEQMVESITKKNKFDLKVIDSYTGDVWMLSKGILNLEMFSFRSFWSNSIKYAKWAAQERPHLFYSFCLGSLGPIIFLIVPPIRKRLGYVSPEPIPKTYPLPKRKRETLEGYDD